VQYVNAQHRLCEISGLALENPATPNGKPTWISACRSALLFSPAPFLCFRQINLNSLSTYRQHGCAADGGFFAGGGEEFHAGGPRENPQPGFALRTAAGGDGAGGGFTVAKFVY
jgi:hypothetical protein